MVLDSWKRRMVERAKRKELQYTGGTPETASFHRQAYHRHFEGYTEIKRLDERGRTVIERVYTGKYYEPELVPYRRITLRLFYMIFFLGGTALFLFCATRTALCNTAPYVNLFQALAVPMVLWCAYILVFYIPSLGKLTVGEYNSQHRPLIRAALLTSVCMWLTGVGSLMCVLLHLETGMGKDLLCVAGFALAGVLIFLIYLLESRLEYAVTNSEAPPPEDGVEIE